MKSRDPREFARAFSEPLDRLSGAWFLSQLIAFILGLCGIALLAGGMGGLPGRHPIAAVALGICLTAGSIGLFLRIEAARMFLLGITGLVSATAAAVWLVHRFGTGPKGPERFLLFAAMIFGGFAVSLAAPATRRLCRRWGVLRRSP